MSSSSYSPLSFRWSSSLSFPCRPASKDWRWATKWTQLLITSTLPIIQHGEDQTWWELTHTHIREKSFRSLCLWASQCAYVCRGRCWFGTVYHPIGVIDTWTHLPPEPWIWIPMWFQIQALDLLLVIGVIDQTRSGNCYIGLHSTKVAFVLLR